MKHRQAGISLIAVALIMGALGALAVFSLISMRQERNLLAEGLGKIKGQAAAVAAPLAAPAAPSGLRKCVIDGKTVVSNTECREQGRAIEIHDTRGIEAPKAPKPPAQAQPSLRDQATERAIERATR